MAPAPAGASPQPVVLNSKLQAEKKKAHEDYTSEGVDDNDVFLLPVSDYQVMIGVTILGAIIRLFRIYYPDSVVFDEVQYVADHPLPWVTRANSCPSPSFGGFASKYIKGKFFMDVHPPLAKLLITLFGYLAGFNGDFDFKEIGKDYIEPGVPYVAMRMFPAICGILLVPTMFLTLKASGCRTFTAAMGAGLIIFGKLPKLGQLGASTDRLPCRERPPYPSSFDPARLASRSRHSLYCHVFHLLHQPA